MDLLVKILKGSALLLVLLGGMLLWSVIMPSKIEGVQSSHNSIHMGKSHRTEKKGVVLEYKTNKPVANVQVQYSYEARSKKNNMPILSGLDHRSTTFVCYATYYTKTNKKGEFSIPPLSNNIKLMAKDDKGRRMIEYEQVLFYHPEYIVLSDSPYPYSLKLKIKATAYPTTKPETRYYYIPPIQSPCGEVLSSPKNYNLLFREREKLNETFEYNYNLKINRKWLIDHL